MPLGSYLNQLEQLSYLGMITVELYTYARA